MDWKSYEDITRHIYETLGKQSGVKIVGFGNSCKIKGKSGVEHQIDVLTSHSDGIHQYKTAIECKYWNETVNKDVVMKVLSVIEDSLINKGVIVSKMGFTQDAKTFANHNGIGLVELREMTDADWEGRIRNIGVSLKINLPTILTFNFLFEQDLIPNIKEGDYITFSWLIRKNNNEKIPLSAYFDDFRRDIQKENKEGIIIEKTYKFEPNTHLIYIPTLEATPILGLYFKGYLIIDKQKFQIKGDDHIWMIMKSIFEGEEYTIYKR